MRSLKQIVIPFIERHIKTFHSECTCLKFEATYEVDGVMKAIWYNGQEFIPTEEATP